MLIGHQKQWEFLVKSAGLNRIPHGILFFGQEQLGKKTLAVEFAKFLVCQSSDYSKRPCQVCRNCLDIQKNVHPDFFLIEPDFQTREIKISQIRKLIQKLSFRPYSACFKIAVLNEAHLMNQDSQNCFLKLLEEPKGEVLLVLVTQYPDMLFSTILSRVQKVRFSPVGNNTIQDYLLEQKLGLEKAKEITSLSLGKPGLCIDFLNSEKLEKQNKYIADLIKISGSDFSFRFKYAKSISEFSKEDLKDILAIWLRYFRNILIHKINADFNKLPTPEKFVNLNGGNFGEYSLMKIKNIINSLQSVDFLLSTTNVNAKLAFEILLMQL